MNEAIRRSCECESHSAGIKNSKIIDQSPVCLFLEKEPPRARAFAPIPFVYVVVSPVDAICGFIFAGIMGSETGPVHNN